MKMRNFIIHDEQGKILRTGCCQHIDFDFQAHSNEFVIEGIAIADRQKIVNGRVVDKTSQEIEAEKSPEIPVSRRPASITNKQWQDVLKRLIMLEKNSG